MHVGLMIEGQDGLTWARWKRLLSATQELGFAHIFRSDHFTNPQPPEKPALELWTSLTYAAATTQHIEFGPLVAPITFRHPAMTAKIAAAIDDLSGGRLTLGLGAGWQDREHRMFGIPFPSVDVRYAMLQDSLEVVTRLLRSDEPSSYSGQHFSLDEATLLARPERTGGPPILIGGNGPKRTLPLVARYADEWNAVYASPDEIRERNERLDGLLAELGRPRDAVRRSAMLGTRFARDEDALRSVQATLRERGTDTTGMLVGTPSMWVEQLQAYAAVGVERVMLQWLEQDNLADLEIVARDVLPSFHNSA